MEAAVDEASFTMFIFFRLLLLLRNSRCKMVVLSQLRFLARRHFLDSRAKSTSDFVDF